MLVRLAATTVGSAGSAGAGPTAAEEEEVVVVVEELERRVFWVTWMSFVRKEESV